MIDPNCVNGIIKQVADFQCRLVCFDYFDTLVTRTCHPEDVKKLCCERIARIFGHPEQGSALYQLRFEMEAKQCRDSETSGKDLEFRLSEMFSELWSRAVLLQSLSQASFVSLAQDIEISVECSVQVLDQDMVEVLRRLSADGYECWLLSDFYLSQAGFARLLSFHEIASLFTRTIVSSETLLTKRSGRLYRRVLEISALDPAAIVMIGDNAVADVESARANGLNSIHIDRSHQHSLYQKVSAKTNDPDHCAARIKEVLAAEPAVFKEVALTLHYFVDKLYSELAGCQAKDVFFLAREGQLLKKMFDHFQDARRVNGAARIRSHYLEVSRRSTFLPSMKPLDAETFDTLFRQYRRISIKEFLASMGLDHLLATLQHEIPFDLDARCDDLPSDPSFQLLLSSPLFRATYELERTQRRTAFLEYLGRFKLAGNSAVLHVVDVGWKGTIQDNIYNVLRDSSRSETGFSSVTGHYVGLVAPGAAGIGNLKTGIVFSMVDAASKNAHVFNENRALFEVVLAADHGSAYSYRVAPSGMAEVIRQEFVEKELFDTKIHPLQVALFDLFCQLDALLLTQVYPLHLMESLVARCHARMLLQPTRTEIAWFEDVYHVENFGVFESSRFASHAKRPGLLSKLRFYRALRKSRGQQDLGFWPWLTCFQNGGKWVASRYALAQMRNIRD